MSERDRLCTPDVVVPTSARQNVQIFSEWRRCLWLMMLRCNSGRMVGLVRSPARRSLDTGWSLAYHILVDVWISAELAIWYLRCTPDSMQRSSALMVRIHSIECAPADPQRDGSTWLRGRENPIGGRVIGAQQVTSGPLAPSQTTKTPKAVCR